ncbi:MAG: class I SAM-dependent methyltransferase [Candidatus Shapirobacteria bacterium]|nr:class I SAM-dependent methyltransferase [Candidatus Shapirobacteria bacterium]
MSYRKQHDIGLAGLALLRNWLVGDDKDAKPILKEIKNLVNKTSTLKRVSVFDIAKGYKTWAETYDNIPNLLMEVEGPIVRSVLKKFKPGDALDIACGTGRYSEFLNSLGHKVIGIDLSPDMLFQARKNQSKQINFLQGDLVKIPLNDKSVDLVICALALTHLPNIDEALSELFRVVRLKGHIVISDIHPWLVALGGQADFSDKSGNYGYVPNYIHWYSSYFKSFKRLGLKVVQCLEPTVEQKHIRLARTGFDLKEKTVETALKDLPIAIVWVLEKP